MAELHVSKKTVSKLFGEMQGRKFIIPDFQRPYKWDEEKCETLWNDIENFSATEAKSGSDYFLGTIVSNQNERKNLEIIDGQQRITSLLLMLRAFFRKLEDMDDDEDVNGLKNQIAPCIWDTNAISQKVTDRSRLHIESLVATEEDNEVFHEILRSGDFDEDKSDNYSVNYRFFKEQCDQYAERNPMQWKQLCVTILQKCIVLPIECDTQETALTIFTTLNDRGLPLADSDIFKAQLYRNQPLKAEQKAFTETWKDLTQVCQDAGITLDDVFRYYTHVLRARDKDKSKEVGLRRYYGEEKYKRLKQPSLLTEIVALADFWFCVNTGAEPDADDGYSLSFESRKLFHCLSYYANEYWKYPVSVFFTKYRSDALFDKKLRGILNNLIAFLFTKFVGFPFVNAIKDDIYGACVFIEQEGALGLKVELDKEQFMEQLPTLCSSRMSRAFLLLDAYLEVAQTKLIKDKFEIEHIFPKKWQDTNYNGWDYESAEKYLDRFGNKIVFEKKLNIQAGNNYFGHKKDRYKNSEIACVLQLSKYGKNDWTQKDIEEREAKFLERISEFMYSSVLT